MNSDTKFVLYNRQKIVHNLDRIVESAKKNKSNAGQLSLFGEDNAIETALEEPVDFNPILIAEREYDAIGFHLTYSPFDEFEILRCRYCNSHISALLESEDGGNNTMLVKIKSIEHKTSQYGNPYAKVIFADETGEERMYVTGDLFREKISLCNTSDIYLLTATFNKETQRVDIVNFDMAKNITPKISTVWIKCPSSSLNVLRMYIKVFLMGDDYDVNIHVSDFNKTLMHFGKMRIDNENLVEMRKHNLEVILR